MKLVDKLQIAANSLVAMGRPDQAIDVRAAIARIEAGDAIGGPEPIEVAYDYCKRVMTVNEKAAVLTRINSIRSLRALVREQDGTE